MVHVLPGRPTGKPDEMSPIDAAAPPSTACENSDGQRFGTGSTKARLRSLTLLRVKCRGNVGKPGDRQGRRHQMPSRENFPYSFKAPAPPPRAREALSRLVSSLRCGPRHFAASRAGIDDAQLSHASPKDHYWVLTSLFD